MTTTVTYEELKTAFNCKRQGDLEKCLRQNGVRFLYGKTGICTTRDALNAAMGLTTGVKADNNQEIEIL